MFGAEARAFGSGLDVADIFTTMDRGVFTMFYFELKCETIRNYSSMPGDTRDKRQSYSWN